MKLIMGIAAVLVCVLTAGSAFRSTVQPETEPAAYVLIENSTGTALESLNAYVRLNCGYLSKLMSLLLIAEDIETGKYRLDTILTASQSVYGTKGAVVWLEPGDKMTVDELLKSVIVGNANDALIVLAEASEQTVDNFVLRMNAEAFDLGLRDTAFYSPCGYSDEREYTTAAELAAICSQLVRYEFLRPYFSTWRCFVKEGQVELVNENTLSRTYDRHIGFKAAHSDLSGYCIAESGRNDSGTEYTAVVLGAPDAESARNKAKTLINSGFTGYRVTAAVFPEEMMRPLDVRGGVESAVMIGLRSQGTVVLPRGAGELRTTVVMPQYLDAPVSQGQVIGTAAFYSGRELVCETDLIAENNVDKLTYWYTFRKMLLNLIE